MQEDPVRTTVDIPAHVFRELEQEAGDQGCSDLIIRQIERARAPHRVTPGRRVRFPIIVSEGPKVELTNEQLYAAAEFP
jgi:hypothetical protein